MMTTLNTKEEFIKDLIKQIRLNKMVLDAYMYYETPQGVVIHIKYADYLKSSFFEFPSHIGTMS